MATENSNENNTEETVVSTSNWATDEQIFTAYQTVALSGKSDACIDKAAEMIGMKLNSYKQRVGKIKRAIKESNEEQIKEWQEDCKEAIENGDELPPKPELITLAPMPRKAKSGVRKTADVFVKALRNVNSELGIENTVVEVPDLEMSDESEGETSED